MPEGYILGIVVAFAFMTLLIISGIPTAFQFITGFDFLWFGGGMIAITTGCVVLTGIPCAILEASYGVLTIAGYAGLGTLLSTGTSGTVSIIKALVLTPISIMIIWLFSKLARGVR